MKKTRVRFAPSPTGFLHIGGARTALFNWLYARHTGGDFILRIEDTDTSRNTQEAVDIILHGLRWLGLDWDEGPLAGADPSAAKGECGPYFQSQRRHIYQQRIAQLQDKGMVYQSEGALKFRMQREAITIPDLIVGDVRRELTDREEVDPDFVIVRSDGQPVFHLVNVIDDLEMGITHVIRGEDHLVNTAKHIALFQALDAAPPSYAHIPLILNQDGTKMSKRERAASLTTYMQDGFVPEAVVNFLSLLGWSPKDDRQILPLAEVVEKFDLAQVLRHNARFDLDKLKWMNAEYFRLISLPRFVELAVPFLEAAHLDLNSHPPDYVHAALATAKDKIKLLTDTPLFTDFYFTEQVNFDPEAKAKSLTPKSRPLLEKLRDTFKSLQDFHAESIETALKSLAKELQLKAGALVHPTRVACTGKSVGPSLYHLMEVLGKDRVLARFNRAIEETRP